MSGTELERAPALFPGSTPEAIIDVAAAAAAQFSDVVKKQRMFKRIGDSDHIQIEAWQTIGALTGVLATDGEVAELEWPAVDSNVGEEPPHAGREPRNRDSAEWQTWKDADRTRRAWELHRDMLAARRLGRAFGFVARFRATKNGVPVGWGEASVDRTEPNWVNRDNHTLRSMAETRAQSRALGAPLRFVVKLAGYEATPAEELDGLNSSPPPNGAGTDKPAPWGAMADDEQENDACRSVKVILEAAVGELDHPDTPAQFVLALGQMFNGVPEASVVTLRGLAKLTAKLRAAAAPPDASTENAPPDPSVSTYHQPPTPPRGPDPNVVYPPSPTGGSRYHGD